MLFRKLTSLRNNYGMVWEDNSFLYKNTLGTVMKSFNFPDIPLVHDVIAYDCKYFFVKNMLSWDKNLIYALKQKNDFVKDTQMKFTRIIEIYFGHARAYFIPNSQYFAWFSGYCSVYNFDISRISKENMYCSSLNLFRFVSSFYKMHVLISCDVHENPGPRNNIKFVSANVQGLIEKLPMIDAQLYSIRADVYMFCETWLRKDIQNSEFCIDGYDVFRKDRNGARGGVAILCKSELNLHKVDIDGIKSEIIVVSCEKLVVVCFYRPQTAKNFLKDMRKIFSWVDREKPNGHLLVAGDVNLPSIKCWNSGFVLPGAVDTRLSRDFISLLNDFSLVQLIDKPTRGNNTLDIIVTNNADLVDTEVISGVSDHDAILGMSSIAIIRKHIVPCSCKIMQWTKADWEKIRQSVSLKLSNFHEILSSQNVDVAWDYFLNVLQSASNDVPFKYFNSRKKDAPYMTTYIKRRIRKKQRLYKKARSTGSDIHWKEYEYFSSCTKKIINSAKGRHLNSLLEDSELLDTRRFYRLVNSNRKDRVGIPDLVCGGHTYSNDHDKAEIFNDTFCAVFQTEDTANVPSKGTSPYPDMPRFCFTSEGVRALLLNLKVNKAAGSDGISPVLLKNLAEVISDPLCAFFEKSYNSGVCPSQFRTAFVCPVYKGKGIRSDPNMYRPISLTPICSKIYEHVFASNMMKFLEHQGILKDEQFGFRKSRSCELQLLMFLDDLLKVYEMRKQIDVVFLDMARAFDKVPRIRLLEKLRYYGIRGRHSDWIGSFLEGRNQQVVVGGEKSSIGAVTSGVPQGTVLGPFLFLIYINDIVDVINPNTSKIRLFADDCVLYSQISCTSDISLFQDDLNAICGWSDKWLMSFNANKSALLHFNRTRIMLSSTYSLYDAQIPVKNEYRYLGVEFSDKFSFTSHIEGIVCKANRSLGFFRRNLKGCSVHIKSKVYETIIRPQLEYCSTVWGPMLRTGAAESVMEKRLESVQSRAARWVLNVFGRTASLTELLSFLGWESLASRRKVDRLCVMYKILNKLVAVPSNYICKKLDSNIRGGRNFHDLSLVVPQTCLNVRKGSFFVRTCSEWNNVKIEHLLVSDAKKFRAELKVP